MRTRARIVLAILVLVGVSGAAIQLYQSGNLGIFADQLATGATSSTQSVAGTAALKQGQLQDTVVTDDGFVQLAPAN